MTMTYPYQRRHVVSAIVLSLFLHAALLLGLPFIDISPRNNTPQQPIDIQLVTLPAPVIETVNKNMPFLVPTERLAEPVTGPPDASTSNTETTGNSGSERQAQSSKTITEPLPETPVRINSSTLRQMALLKARQTSTFDQETYQSDGLPGNWTQDALPAKLATRENLLDPLTYYGSAGTETWKSPDGALHSRTTLPDGTIVCSDQYDTADVPGEIETRFSSKIMLHKVCGQLKGGRESKNKLARYHPGYTDPADNAD